MTDIAKYPKSGNGNFSIVDTIGVPHPYCITSKHLQGEGMYLDNNRIKEAEKVYGAVCDICKSIHNKDFSRPILTYDEHEQALLVSCKVDIHDNQELKDYLLSIKSMAEADNFAGFAFKQDYEQK